MLKPTNIIIFHAFNETCSNGLSVQTVEFQFPCLNRDNEDTNVIILWTWFLATEISASRVITLRCYNQHCSVAMEISPADSLPANAGIHIFVEFATLSVPLTVWRRMVGWSANNELERQARPHRDIIPAFSWRDWGTPRKSLLRIFGVPLEIRTKRRPNTSLERHCCCIGVSEDIGRQDIGKHLYRPGFVSFSTE
jgi:hypothetical protein